MVSMDVVNKDSNVPHDYGIQTIKYWLETFPHELPNRTKGNFIIESLEFIFKNNYFIFNETPYREKSETAMGTNFAPTYANLVM